MRMLLSVQHSSPWRVFPHLPVSFQNWPCAQQGIQAGGSQSSCSWDLTKGLHLFQLTRQSYQKFLILLTVFRLYQNDTVLQKM